jgi:hypothetical protein
MVIHLDAELACMVDSRINPIPSGHSLGPRRINHVTKLTPHLHKNPRPSLFEYENARIGFGSDNRLFVAEESHDLV